MFNSRYDLFPVNIFKCDLFFIENGAGLAIPGWADLLFYQVIFMCMFHLD